MMNPVTDMIPRKWRMLCETFLLPTSSDPLLKGSLTQNTFACGRREMWSSLLQSPEIIWNHQNSQLILFIKRKLTKKCSVYKSHKLTHA